MEISKVHKQIRVLGDGRGEGVVTEGAPRYNLADASGFSKHIYSFLIHSLIKCQTFG